MPDPAITALALKTKTNKCFLCADDRQL